MFTRGCSHSYSKYSLSLGRVQLLIKKNRVYSLEIKVEKYIEKYFLFILLLQI